MGSSASSPAAPGGGGASDDVVTFCREPPDETTTCLSAFFSLDSSSTFSGSRGAEELSAGFVPPLSFAIFSFPAFFTSFPTNFSTFLLAIIFRAIISLSFLLFPTSIGGERSLPRLPLLPERCLLRRLGDGLPWRSHELYLPPLESGESRLFRRGDRLE